MPTVSGISVLTVTGVACRQALADGTLPAVARAWAGLVDWQTPQC